MIPLTDTSLVLASTSRYRRELLARVGAPFRVFAPDVNETPHADESPAQIAVRLAIAKARAGVTDHPHTLIIGSDQVADCDGVILGKPGDHANARRQLQACAGRSITFHTAICLIDSRCAPAREHIASDITRVIFRQIDDEEIERYLLREQPYDCAGSFKCEGLGIGLCERIESIDPTALIGLPLIALCRLLRAAGVAAI